MDPLKAAGTGIDVWSSCEWEEVSVWSIATELAVSYAHALAAHTLSETYVDVCIFVFDRFKPACLSSVSRMEIMSH